MRRARCNERTTARSSPTPRQAQGKRGALGCPAPGGGSRDATACRRSDTLSSAERRRTTRSQVARARTSAAKPARDGASRLVASGVLEPPLERPHRHAENLGRGDLVAADVIEHAPDVLSLEGGQRGPRSEERRVGKEGRV